MADELNVPTHRWYEPRNNISLPKTDFSAQTIYASGIQKIDAWINSQPWGNPVPGLFALAEPGVWYDPSDLNTLFQDAAGTTPVTAAGQPVGLVLDKSKGLVLGPELVTNGTFGTDTGWTKGAGWTISGGVASRTNVSAISGLSQTVTATQGKFYQITIDVVVTGGSIIGIRLGSTSQITTTITTSGTYTYRVACDGTNNTLNVVAQTNFVGTIDNISVRELPGSHARQAAPESRPTYQIDGTGRPYLSFDGVDDFLVTPTITPGIDKVQVFAGVRVIGSSAGNFIVETSTDLAANNGTVHLIVPNNSPFGGRGFRSKGTIAAVADTANNAYTAPISQVLSGLGDISGDLATLRVNGTQAAQSTADQGSGNYLAYPLYIGRRAGTSLPFNGNLFSLIVRFGANLDANTISQTETWVNSKTGAY